MQENIAITREKSKGGKIQTVHIPLTGCGQAPGRTLQGGECAAQGASGAGPRLNKTTGALLFSPFVMFRM